MSSIEPAGAEEHSLRRNVKRFRGGLVFKAHRLVYHSTLGLRVMNRRKKNSAEPALDAGAWSFIWVSRLYGHLRTQACEDAVGDSLRPPK